MLTIAQRAQLAEIQSNADMIERQYAGGFIDEATRAVLLNAILVQIDDFDRATRLEDVSDYYYDDAEFYGDDQAVAVLDVDRRVAFDAGSTELGTVLLDGDCLDGSAFGVTVHSYHDKDGTGSLINGVVSSSVGTADAGLSVGQVLQAVIPFSVSPVGDGELGASTASVVVPRDPFTDVTRAVFRPTVALGLTRFAAHLHVDHPVMRALTREPLRMLTRHGEFSSQVFRDFSRSSGGKPLLLGPVAPHVLQADYDSGFLPPPIMFDGPDADPDPVAAVRARVHRYRDMIDPRIRESWPRSFIRPSLQRG
jgi:hypothetical protein